METIEKTKSEFQRLSIELESALEEYKNRYPKNFGQIFRSFAGLTIWLVCLFFMSACVMTLSPGLTIFGIFSVIGIKIYGTVAYHSDTNDDSGQNDAPLSTRTNILTAPDKKSLAKIDEILAKLEPFLAFPDVANYCDMFKKQVETVKNQKKALGERFKKVAKNALYVVGAILVFLFVRMVIIVKTL